ncbi:MAG TPA: NAD-dependent epimerase/dehydratase family protein [Burkholderiales bacterium]|jgi:UDP-glucuronate 4-epimerase|nr:NAD-dependent epimerase/dehydratase family protein [Burkholderiales bacterium]
MRVLLTGAAGFIGMHCAERLCARGDEVLGLDSLTPPVQPQLTQARLERVKALPRFRFERLDIVDAAALEARFAEWRPERVLHLAAQAGVRYSLEKPAPFVQSNLVGFANVLEGCRRHPPAHLVFASSSSVYGSNTKLPWSESDSVDHPVSLYAATKKSNELMGHAYAHLFGVPATGLRYFTVYGPWGRPDMSPALFASAIMEGRPIQVFNRGDMERDFTYVDDVVEATLRVLDSPPAAKPPFRVFNVGNHRPTRLLDYIATLEKALGKKAVLELKPMQPGDVKSTFADNELLRKAVGFTPATALEDGLTRYARWFRSHYGYA